MITAAKQRGFGVAAAIFILLVLAVLGAFIVSVSTTQHAAAALDVQGTETYRVARTGIEWGVYRVLKDATHVCGTNNIGPINGMGVTVTCSSAVANEVKPGGGTITIYSIAATACNSATPPCPGDTANPNYVERKLTAMVGK